MVTNLYLTSDFCLPISHNVTLSAIFDRTKADGFVLCHAMKLNDDLYQTVYTPVSYGR